MKNQNNRTHQQSLNNDNAMRRHLQNNAIYVELNVADVKEIKTGLTKLVYDLINHCYGR